ncbi:nuclear transport factor 2 family protein [Actinorhabdospora filicis]|nr:nuclear transport factor 2 family protein [Actinorhabdospora filicis]
MDELIDLEERGWRALATEGAAERFYHEVLDDEPLMLLPGGLRIADREEMVRLMSRTPWEAYRLSEPTVTRPSNDVGVVDYVAHAVREGGAYAALVSSHYVRRGDGWRLYFHQQTPR